MGLPLLLILIGVCLFGTVAGLVTLRRDKIRYKESPPEPILPVNLMEDNNAVLVAEGRGHLVFANPTARTWFGMNGGEPNLEALAETTRPADTFLELFGKEGHASFRIGSRRVEATSHYIPKPDAHQMVVVIHELSGDNVDQDTLDPVQAMNVVSEIAQTISGSLDLDRTLDSILSSINGVITFDAGEITLWDEDLQILRPRGKRSDTQYFEEFDKTDGVYHLEDSFSGWLARYRQPLLIGDVTTRPDVRPKLKDYPFRSYIGVPLMVSTRFIGTLELGSRTLMAFDHEDMTLLQAIAGQAGIAIENARLYQSQSERVAELSGLQEIASAMTALRDARQMYGQLTSRIAGLMNVEMCGILLYDAEEQVLISQPPFFGVPDSVISMYRIPLPEGSLMRSIYNGRDWWYTNNVKGDDLVRQSGLLGLAEAVGVRTTALVPMIIGDRRFGVVQASNKRDGSGFSENDARLLAVFASQAAIVVENVRLYDEEQRRADELGGLQQISQAIGVLRDANELYGQINERIARLMNVQICGILLHAGNENLLVSQTPFYGVSDELLPFYQIPLEENSLFYKVYSEREYLIVNNLIEEPAIRTANLDRLMMPLGIRHTLIVPLIAAGRRLGLAQIANKLDGNEFTEDDARILLIFAAQAAVIIDNARLYREMRQRADESERLRRIAEIASSNLPLDELINGVAKESTLLLDSEMCFVSILDETSSQLTVRPQWTAGLEGQLSQPFTIDVYAPGFQTSVLISRRPFLSNDIRADGQVLPVYRGIAERFNFSSVIQVPLIVRENSVGELTVASNRSDKDYTSEDLRLLKAVAIQLAAAMERNQLYKETDTDLRTRIQQLDSLTRVSNELNLTIDLERILEIIRYEAQRTTNAEMSTVAMLKPVEERVKPSEPEIEQRLGSGNMITGLASIERQAIDRQDLVMVSNYETVNFEPQPPKARSAIVAPIIYGEQVVGTIHVNSPTADAFPIQAQDFMRALSNQAAIAVGNAIRFRQQLQRSELLKQRADQLSHIFELGRLLRSEDTIEGLLEAVAQGITEAVGFNIVMISTAEPKTKTLRRVAQAGLALNVFREMQKVETPTPRFEALLKPKYRISSSYFLPGEESVSWTVPDLPLETFKMSAEAKGTRAWDPNDLLIVPLRNSANELIGAVSVDDPREGKRPTQQTIEALEIFANQAAFAIENYNLLQAYQSQADAARRERDSLERLHLVASEIQRSTDMSTRLKVVAEGIRAAGWGRVAITLRDHNLEPRETITAGYSNEEAAQWKANVLSGMVWSQRLSDPDFRQYRVGQAYYLRASDQWVTENKRIAGNITLEPLTDLNRWHPLDTVYLPLYGLDRSRLIGIISMDSPQDGQAPTENSMRPFELFANQAASAIENTRLYEETIRSKDQETRINQMMEAVASTLDLDEIIHSVASGLNDMIVFTRMSIALVGKDPRFYEVKRILIDLHGGISVEPGEPLPVENSAVGLAIQETLTKVYHLMDADRTPEYLDLKAWRASGERTSLIVPMLSGGRVTGALHMGSELSNAFGFEEQLPLVSRMANLAAIAVENAQLFQQTIEREKFSSALGRVGQSVSSVLDRSSLIARVCDEAISILDVAGAYVWLVEGNDLVGIGARGPAAGALNGMHLSLMSNTLEAQVIKDQASLFANDLGKVTPRWKIIIQTEQMLHAILGIPLFLEGKAVGVMTFIRTDPRQAFIEEDIEKAFPFAAQLAIALNNARLYEDIENRARQLNMLTVVSGELTATLEPDAVVQLLLERLGAILDYDRVTLWLRRGEKLIIRAARGYTDAEGLIGVEVEIADSALFRDLASRGQVLNIPDVTKDPRFPIAEEGVTRSWLGVSLVSRNALAGLLVMEKNRINFYTPTMEQLALTFANQAAVSLENARLFQEATRAAEENTRLYRETSVRARELDQQTRRLALLNSISTMLTQSLDVEDVFDVTLRETTQVLGVTRGGAILFEPNPPKGRLVYEYPRGDSPPNEEIPLESLPILDELRHTMRPVAIADVANDPRVESVRADLLKRGILSSVYIPLAIGGQLIGSLSFESVDEQRDFAPEQLDVAQTIAAQAAVAVQNANLYKQSLTRTRELETLFEATQATSATLNLDEVMRNTARQMAFALQADDCEILTWDEVGNAVTVELDSDINGDTTLIDRPGTSYDLSKYPIRERALRARQMIVVRASDPNLTEDEKALLEKRQAYICIVLPMVVREQAIGLIEIESRDRSRDFTAGDTRLARTLTAQAAVAIENARLQTETASKLEELFAINELAIALAAAIEQEQIIQIVRLRLPSLIRAQIWLMALLEEDQETVTYPVAVRDGKPFEFASHLLGDDEVSFVIKRRTAQRLAGSEIEGVLRNLKIVPRFPNAKSFLSTPMISGDMVVGALILADEQNPRTFNLDTQRILSTVGAQIAVAMRNARLFAQTRRFTAQLEKAVEDRTLELQRERDRIDFLYRITTGLSASFDTDMVLNRALEMIAHAIDADMGAILGIDPISDNLIYRTTLNIPIRENEPAMAFSQHEGLPGWVIEMQQSVIVDDVQSDPRWLHINPFDEEPRSAIVALLAANEDILGIIMLYSRQPNKFNEDHLRLVTAAANQIATAMNNAELYTLIREQAERLSVMIRREQIDSTKTLAIVGSIADGVMYADRNGDISQFNSAAERILGLPRANVLNRHISELAGLYAKAGGRRWLEVIERWTADPLEHQTGEEFQVQLELDNGRYVSIVLSPVIMADQFLGTVSVIRDITREIEVDRMQAKFIENVSHELRTPMTSIKGYADLLLLGAAGQVNEQQQRFLTTIKSNSDRLSDLVNKLLEAGRVDRGVVTLNLVAVDAVEALDVSIRHLEERIQSGAKDITLVTHIPEDLPSIRADLEKITDVFTNLVDNAYNYTERGTITVDVWAEKNSVVFSIADTGIGIATEKQDRIWNRFFRDDEQRLVIETAGAGLGLSIVKEYVNMHEGQIWLTSEPGKGTTFYVRIPTFVPDETTEAA